MNRERAARIRRREAGSALLGALMTLALAGAAAAALAELGRLALVRARLDRDGARAWFLAEARLADVLAAIPPGTDFTASLGAATPDSAGPWTATSELRDDADDWPDDRMIDANQHVILRVTASGPGSVRRRLQALLARTPDPFFPAAVTLAGGVRELTGDFRADGRNGAVDGACSMDGSGRARAGLSVPEGADLPGLDHAEQLTGRGGTPSVARAEAPDLRSLADAPGAVRLAAGTLAGSLGGGLPQLTVVTGDATIGGAVAGGGVLYVTGRLRIDGTLAFTGVVAAGEGVEITSGGEIAVCGALWAAGDPALDARGRGTIRASTEAVRWAAGVAPLPARARAIAVRELF